MADRLRVGPGAGGKLNIGSENFAELRDRGFQPFQRVGDRSADAGAGLGLAIAKGFVEVCGGTIEVDDTPGGGCTFTIRLPRATESGRWEG